MVTDTLQWVSENMTITVSNQQVLYSSSNMETSLLGFRLDNLFHPLVAFAAQLTFSVNPDKIPFDRVLVAEGTEWNSASRAFTVLQGGSYFFS